MFRPPRAYVYLETAASAGSIRKAAKRLRVASTSLNRKILEIETELGVPLFERVPRGVRLTAAGEVILDTIRRNLRDIDTANARILELQGLVRGNVSIAVAHSVANDFIQTAIIGFQERHPGVRFQLRIGATKHLVGALMRDETELLLAHDPVSTSDFDVFASARQPLYAMMRRDHPLARRGRLRLTDCQPYPLALGHSSFGGRHLLDKAALRNRMTLNVALESNTIRSLKAYAMRTDAICFQFEIGAREEVRSGEMAALPLIDPELDNGKLVFASRKGRALSLATRSFVETVKQELARI